MEIKQYTLRNDHLEVTVINLGACITKLVVLKTGINVIVGHDDLEDYRTNQGYMNATIGRHAGRTREIIIDDETFEIGKNSTKGFQLHGGLNGFHTKFFDAVVKTDQITFTTTSPHLEEGYPGDVEFEITYKLVGDSLHLLYQAVSSQKTVMSFTNHAYFNLNGDIQSTILNHDLMINAKSYIVLDQNMIPLNSQPLQNTPLDFGVMKQIGRDIESDFDQVTLVGGYDHPYIINQTAEINHVASLQSPKSGIKLDVYSDQDCVVLYTGNVMDESMLLNNGIPGIKHGALCLETQGIPNASYIEEFKGRNIVSKNEVYKQTTIWRFTR